MTLLNDAALLCRYCESRSEAAFSELLRRHLNLVFFAALRQTGGDAHRAEDVAQETFVLLAQKASGLQSHPALAGWLYSTACHRAREVRRTETSRLEREKALEFTLMTVPESDDHTWLRVRPIIDQALQELSNEDREAVLLRFFENRPFAEIGRELNRSENTVRMRVTRALENLERVLAKQGVTSTGAALAAALTVPAAMAAPAGLAQQICLSVLAATSTSAAIPTFGILKLMTSSKFIAAGATFAVLFATGLGLYQHRLLEASRIEQTASQEREAVLAASLRDLKAQLANQKNRAEEADRDNEKLLTAMAQLQLTGAAEHDVPNSTPLTPEFVNGRFRHAKDLAKSGQHAEALKEYLWCFDTGMRQVSGLFGIRGSSLLSSIFELGKNYPPALDALVERRDNSKIRLEASSVDSDALMDYASINRQLGEANKTWEFYNNTSPLDQPLRAGLASYLKDELLDAHRYSEFVAATPYLMMSGFFDIMASFALKPGADVDQRPFVTKATAQNIEALAGSGDVAHARELITKLLGFDHSPSTQAALQKAVTRAGHPELLAPK